MCHDVTLCFKKGGEDLWVGACEGTSCVVYEVCKASGIYSSVDLLDDGKFDKVVNVTFSYGFLV